MKKTIVALAVAAVAATSANAATVYNQDGTKVDVNGSLRLILKKEKNERGDLVDNGSRVSFKASHDLGEGLSALAYTELRFSKNVPVQVKDQQGEVVREYEVEKLGNNVHVKRLYAGFAYEGLGTLTFGNQLTIGDDVGLSDYTYFNSGINNLLSSGEKAINFKSAEFNGFTFGGAYVFSADADKQALRDGRGFVVAGLYNRKMGDVGFAFEAGYSQKYVKQEVEQNPPAAQKVFKDEKEKAFMVGAELSYAGLALGVDYAQSKVTNVDGKKRALEVGLNYDLNDRAKVYTDFIWEKEGPKGDVTRNRTVAVGFGYKLHKQVETFVEAAWGREKDSDGVTTKNNVVGTGLRVHF
ncbi:porin [Pasteurella multocida]|uniref:Major outer membrane protein n=4 Tax=Pasteurella multocida TaxID=747 RepID=OMPH1_PASMD|nr:porin [Pasteurella multocida]O54339.1 RecName: Full=Major outer membrane protein; Short=MOMP; AltName: Full=Outer membrane protein H; Flags: Precursor [Pasteurella multocida]AAC02243.1 outer membrane protein [Pasteurella multocida]ABM97414.1 adhesive protein [Pasteurella multocida]AFS64556.1 adhesive outer membrane protein [Pasteurella multocida]ARB74641.1 major outer membrane protein [Pasteurella multocida]EJZ79658.1 OmpH [Pasteurella multocida subsp. gallicida X73]